MPLSPGDVVTGLRGAYRIDARHGEGSFGITYRASDASTGAAVIVKELRIEKLSDWKALELFEREGEVLATLSHPSIPAFRDFFAHGGPTALPVSAMGAQGGPEHLSLVLVQQLVEGETLQQRVDQRGAVSPNEVEAILRALLDALRYLHERTPPLVHRDIKPGNIIVTPSGAPYLVDFGAIQNRLTRAESIGSTIVGTLGYMPLEQIRGDARPASDLYALGVTMVVALAGRPLSEIPFDDETGKIGLARALPPHTPARLRRALDAMVAPLLGQRAHSAAEVLSRLDVVERPPVYTWQPKNGVGEPPAPPSDARDLDVQAFQTSLGLRGWLRRRNESTPGVPSKAMLVAVPVGIGLAIALIAFAMEPSVVDGSKAQFAKRYHCPLSSVVLHARPDIDVASFEGRPKSETGSDEIFELSGCAHHVLWACRSGRTLTSCGYEHDLGTSAPSAGASSPGTPEIASGPVTITWNGHLDASTGAAPPIGAACTLSATVVSRGGRTQEDRLTFECDGQILYDSSVPLSGMSDSMFDLGEVLLGDDDHGQLAYDYVLGAKDIGTRAPPRAQLMTYTPRGDLDAWRDTVSTFRVHAKMDHTSSARYGRALRTDTTIPFDTAVTRDARVTGKTGTSPFSTSACRVHVAPANATNVNCRVRLECGGAVVYGAGSLGFGQCVIVDRKPKSFVDSAPTSKDGDPELSCDLDQGTATLGDTTTTGATYSVAFALTEVR